MLESAPETVRLDPDFNLLARITFDLPKALLGAQLADRGEWWASCKRSNNLRNGGTTTRWPRSGGS